MQLKRLVQIKRLSMKLTRRNRMQRRKQKKRLLRKQEPIRKLSMLLTKRKKRRKLKRSSMVKRCYQEQRKDLKRDLLANSSRPLDHQKEILMSHMCAKTQRLVDLL